MQTYTTEQLINYKVSGIQSMGKGLSFKNCNLSMRPKRKERFTLIHSSSYYLCMLCYVLLYLLLLLYFYYVSVNQPLLLNV